MYPSIFSWKTESSINIMWAWKIAASSGLTKPESRSIKPRTSLIVWSRAVRKALFSSWILHGDVRTGSSIAPCSSTSAFPSPTPSATAWPRSVSVWGARCEKSTKVLLSNSLINKALETRPAIWEAIVVIKRSSFSEKLRRLKVWTVSTPMARR